MKRVHRWIIMLLVCIVVVGIKGEAFAATAWEMNEEGVYVNSRGTQIQRASARGIDISKYQQPPYTEVAIEWDKVANEDVDFVIIRTGYGMAIDETFSTSVTAFETLGMPYGVYHYTHAKTAEEARKEAELVLSQIQGHQLSYPVYYDMESKGLFEQLTKEQCLKNAKAFSEVLNVAGYETGIYANMNWFKNKLTDSWYQSQNRWLARYIYDYTYDWPEMVGFSGLWQCTDSGTIDGISGPVDINFMIEDVPAKVNFTKTTSASYNKHKLTWGGIAGVSGYEIWCKKPGADKYTIEAKVASDATSYNTGNRTTDKNYYYKIRAYKRINGKVEYGAYSNVKKVKAVLGTVTLTSVKRSSKTKVTLKWKKVSGASGYKIYYSSKKGSGYKLLKTVTKGSTTSVKVDVKKGKKYYYKIRAYRNVSKKPVYGKYSSVKSCK